MIKARIGSQPASLLGMNSLLDFSMEVTLDGGRLNAAEIKAMMRGVDGLQLIRGHWVEVDRKKLGRLLDRFQSIVIDPASVSIVLRAGERTAVTGMNLRDDALERLAHDPCQSTSAGAVGGGDA